MVFSNFPKIQRNLPVINLVIASSALCFQVLVLYPWHLQLDESHHRLIKRFNDLSKDINTLQKEQEIEKQQIKNTEKKLKLANLDSLQPKQVNKSNDSLTTLNTVTSNDGDKNRTS